MKIPVKKALFSATLTLSLSAIPSAYAVWPLVWATVKTAAAETISYFATDILFDEEVTKEEMDALESKNKELDSKIKELESKLAEAQAQGDAPSKQEFEEMKKTVENLKTVRATLAENRTLPPAQRVEKMEKEVAPLRDFVINGNTSPKQRKENLNIDVNYAYRVGNQGNAKPLKNNAVLHSGDSYKLVFTPKQEGYIYVFQVDSANKIQRLFPMSEFKGVKFNNENPVLPNKTYSIPAKDKSFRLDNQTGTEKIYFFASRGQDVFLEAQYEAVLRAQKQNGGKVESAQMEKSLQNKGMSDIVNDPSSATSTIEMEGETFSLLKTLLEGACNGCVNVLTFEHK